ncbi:acyl carrier protein [Candidatus Mycobacterium wuenschmannii]|jgi:acyl carrier protein|uniref:Acyl carrier protein n=1 Tax=Candidatus Mycobacterium wuenschmannii TaxID=3027808 RepID=A0ABY8VUH9_9MYCO|nr:acyl carrier protein [Candidatus Mycobacterium wuenschmannii]WIM86680.1 acyl carrier protein [Candidatus Mycobacterium wuenschmannii]
MTSDLSRPDSVSAALTEILRDDLNIDVSRVTPESRLVDDVGLDSVAFAVGMVAIEDKLGVVVNEQELLGCDTVGDLENVIRAKVPVGQ